MKAKIVTTPIGCFGVSEEGEIVTYVKFPKDSDKIVGLLEKSKKGMIGQEKTVEKELKKKGFTDIQKGGSGKITSNLRTLAIENKFVKSAVEFNSLVSKINIALTKKKIKRAVTRDQLVMQANNSIEELDKTINIMAERLREWYGLHFPEMDRAISDHKKFAELVSEFGSRENIKYQKLSRFKEKSMGADFKKEDIAAVRQLASQLVDIFEVRDKISKYMDSLLQEIVPNTREIAGPVLAAKLISLAGGLQKLARMPSSTVQLLGAEKALFRHLHGRGKSPKHGIIVTHHYVKNAPSDSKGKVARLLASKISIAAKLDFYSDKRKGGELKKDLEEKVKDAIKSG